MIVVDRNDEDIRLGLLAKIGLRAVALGHRRDAGHSFREFDVYSRTCGAARDAYRIIVDLNTSVVWFSPNHYSDFYKI